MAVRSHNIRSENDTPPRRLVKKSVRALPKAALIACSAVLAAVITVIFIAVLTGGGQLVKIGDRGEYIATLQKKLYEAGCYASPVPSGFCGASTMNAVTRYRDRNSLGAGKGLDKKTVMSLFGEDGDDYIATLKIVRSFEKYQKEETRDGMLKTGDSGEKVAGAQARLKYYGYYENEPSGFFGRETYLAVMLFREANSLDMNGLIDAELVADLTGEDAISLEAYHTRLKVDSATAGDENAVVRAAAYRTGSIVSAHAEIEVWDEKYSEYVEMSPIGNSTAIATQNTGELPFARGSQDEKIKQIQMRLKELGFYTYGDITNFFGSITEAAVKKFQSANGLQSSGAVDQATWDSLFSPTASAYVAPSESAQTAPTADPSNLKLGDEDARVAELQTRLKELGYYTYNNITNYYGTITQSAVRTFQRANGLTADGVSGAATQERLFASDAVTYDAYIAAGGSPDSARDETIDDLIAFAKGYLGCRYVYGGAGPSVFDCSGFTMYVYRNFGYSFGHGCIVQSNALGAQLSVAQLMPGDLVFFDTNGGSWGIEHAGIYIGNGEFIHASSGSGSVVISNLTSGFYSGAFMWGKRVIPL